MQRLYRVAERHGRLPRDSPVARELVTDAIDDLILGETPCDPDGDLPAQLERHVRRSANRWRKGRPELVPLSKAPPSALVIEPETGDDAERRSPDAVAVVSRIRADACEDEPVRQLLALYARDITQRRDVLRNGMTEWTYRAARDRLVAYAERAMAAIGEDHEELPAVMSALASTRALRSA